MASVTGMTAEAIDAQLDMMVTSVRVSDTGHVIFRTKGGVETDGGLIGGETDSFLDQTWPVGSIFIGAVTTSPADLIGVGTWTRFAQGSVLVSQLNGDPDFGVIGQSGGVKAVTLSAAQSGLPGHSHSFTPSNGGQTGDSKIFPQFNEESSASNGATPSIVRRGTGAPPPAGQIREMLDSAHHHSFGGSVDAVAAAAASAPHTNIQPYVTVYMWRRTA